ncbi:MAG: acetyl-CoA carboxylase biotin carboxyl carrier protein [Clostridia bacterium]|uniref:Biotin carboxyl carrier protein of acetyl-CoA carboxylase n=1 Tax=Mogibacterium kristiansenii TaxID=2606708 RepID=A0A6N7XGH6_9FIRM|nr:acetyl-CoA carboxylase biotin carboxyl carrier protein [Mogibacterium kristiansenii]MDY5450710.1 acetyl-CoA carboxylase biotin carboxyl carrier protein [Clostridia bacterium]MST70318.1 acetyl-CoA carboxylase biotin carboxyl carrier protein [Mogibacterium kristiansenii]
MDSQKIVKDLLNEFKESDLTEFEMETAELRLRFGRGVNAGSGMASGNSFAQNNPAAERVSGNAAAPAASASETVKENAPSASAPENVKENAPAAGTDDNLEPVKAPLVGTFYAAPSPDADPFVQEGQKVSKGETLCILEAMKMMNELTAPYDLIVRRILGVNGEMAEYNQVLFEVEKC